jgi:hypothetical protein
MLALFLWPVLAVWMGLAFVVLAAIVGTIGYATVHLLYDRRGVDGDLWCPVHCRKLHVHGVPTRFLRAPFTSLSRCENYGSGRLRCGRWCLSGWRLAQAARAN